MTDNFSFDAKNITTSYGRKKVVSDCSFNLKSNTLTALLGTNGCGKTTLLKSIAGILPHGGESMLTGEKLENLSRKRKAQLISYMPQRTGISMSIPVIDVVLMGYNPFLRLLEDVDKSRKAKVCEALRKLGLEEYINEDFLKLSEGQKQLVYLARTMIEESKLILLDEPDSALDFNNKNKILSLLKEMLTAEKKIGLVCLHDPQLALYFCDKLLLMKNGTIISELSPEKDSISYMEKNLRLIYQDVSLHEITGKNGEKHLALIWEK